MRNSVPILPVGSLKEKKNENNNNNKERNKRGKRENDIFKTLFFFSFVFLEIIP